VFLYGALATTVTKIPHFRGLRSTVPAYCGMSAAPPQQIPVIGLSLSTINCHLSTIMRPATIQQIKQELAVLKPAQLNAVCLRLAKFKKENKELLTYLLFEAGNEADYVQSIKEQIAEQFAAINTSSVYFIKKSLRKIVRLINRYAGFSEVTVTELELRLHFCQLVQAQGWPMGSNKALENIYEGQVKKVKTLMDTLHPDERYDYQKQVYGIM
jgi:hypothetical protein